MLFVNLRYHAGLLTLLACQSANAKVTRYLGASIQVNDVPFYIHPEPVGRIPAESMPLPDEESDWLPMTLVDATWDFTQATLDAIVSSHLSRDDVFNDGFLQALYLRDMNNTITTTTRWSAANSTIAFSSTLSSDAVTAPAGPYILSLSRGTIHIPYRLYTDIQGAFHQGVVPVSDGSFMVIPAAVPGSSAMTIGVPSRLYCTPSSDRPLCGVRLGVKDIYDLRGLKTGAGSRAYYATYPEADTTAVSVDRLIAAGAVVVGKIKTTQFAAPENAQDAIDYQAPFNPRGDGYQQPGSSSSGAGSAMASYDWLDLALGSDTGGSVRVPAEANGVFGNRPSHEMVPLTNVVPLAPQFDTPGFLARDAELWSSAIRVLYSGLETDYSTYPSSLITMDIPSKGPAGKVYSNFISRLTKFLSASTPVDFDLATVWTQSRPAGTPANIQEHLNLTWAVIAGHEQTRLVKKDFFSAYADQNEGREPHVNPATQGAWEWAATQSDLFEEAVANKTLFQDWWNGVILASHKDTCSRSLMLYVFQPPIFPLIEPSYVFTYPEMAISSSALPGVLLGFNTGFISPMAGNPDHAVPIGEVEYVSDVTKQAEKKPLSIRIMAARGCDQMLADLVVDLDKEGIIPKIKTGRSLERGDGVVVVE